VGGSGGHGYRRSEEAGQREIDEEEQAQIDALLLERVQAKRVRDFARADDLRDRLREHDCFVDDRANTYVCRILAKRRRSSDRASEGSEARPPALSTPPPPPPPRFVRDPNDGGGAESLTAEQEERLQERLVAQREAQAARDFAIADAIRDELRREMGIVLNSRTSSYRILPPPQPSAGAATSRLFEPSAGWSSSRAEAPAPAGGGEALAPASAAEVVDAAPPAPAASFVTPGAVGYSDEELLAGVDLPEETRHD